MKRLNDWLALDQTTDEPRILCVNCEQRVPLWDAMEREFASPETLQHVYEMQAHVRRERAGFSR